MEHDEPGRLPILISYACFARPQVGTRAPERLRLTVQGRQTWGYFRPASAQRAFDTASAAMTAPCGEKRGLQGPLAVIHTTSTPASGYRVDCTVTQLLKGGTDHRAVRITGWIPLFRDAAWQRFQNHTNGTDRYRCPACP